MNKFNFARFLKNAEMTIVKHSPEILTGIGIAGMITTTVLAVKATPKALRLIEEKKQEENVDKLTPSETVKATWKCYIPAVVTGVASTACLIGASSVNARRTAALATAYKLSETALTEYREKVVETVGEKKEQIIREKIDKDRIENNPVNTREVIITAKGDTLCYDAISGRYFKSDIDQIKRSINILNRRLLTEMYISLNELYDELDLDHIEVGDSLGWNIDDGLIDLYFSSQLAKDGTPCVVLSYERPPKYGYSSFV